MKSNLSLAASLAMTLASLGCAHGRSRPNPCAKPPKPQREAAVLKASYVEPVVVAAPIEDTPAPVKSHYVVRKGDSLWKIAGKPMIYGDPMLWPIIYKDNRDQISDPDFIDPDQDLSYRQTVDDQERAEAIQKAKDTPLYVPHAAVRNPLPLNY